MRILICGLPGSGKSTLSQALVDYLGSKRANWYNADEVRSFFEDWDFSMHGRQRQAMRMRKICTNAEKFREIAIADFVCPTRDFRQLFDADITIWMNTIKEGRFENTNKVFEKPKPDEYDLEITADEWWDPDADHKAAWVKQIVEMINGKEEANQSE